MGRRHKKSDDPPVSLFAFQDIITSITGIMILVVLMLILDVIASKTVASAAVAPSSPYHGDVDELQKTLAKIQSEIRQEEQWETRNEAAYKNVIDNDVENLRKKINDARRKADDLKTDSQRLASARDDLKEENANIEKRTRNVRQLTDDLAGKLQAARNELERKLDEKEDVYRKIEELKKNLKDHDNRVKFSPPKGESREAFFVECAMENIKCKRSGGEQVWTFESGGTNVSPMIKRFADWLDKRDAKSNYLVLIVKPSAVSYLGSVIEMVKRRGFSYGMEPLEENLTGVYE